MRDTLDDMKDIYEFNLYDGSVEYVLSNKYANMIESENRLDMAFVKRRAFLHEREYRFLITSKKLNKKLEWHKNGVKIKIEKDLCDIIHKVFIDPFAFLHLVKAIRQYFSKNFDINCSQSSIYKEPLWDS